MRGGRDAGRRDLLHLGYGTDDDIELTGEMIKLVSAQRQPGQRSEMRDLIAGYGHPAILEGHQGRAERISGAPEHDPVMTHQRPA